MNEKFTNHYECDTLFGLPFHWSSARLLFKWFQRDCVPFREITASCLQHLPFSMVILIVKHIMLFLGTYYWKFLLGENPNTHEQFKLMGSAPL